MLAPMLRFAISTASSIFFSETPDGNLPVRSMKKTTSCKRETELPGWISSLIGQKNFFLANQRDGFRHFWNSFGKKKCPGALQPLKQTFAPKMSLARKYRIVPTSSPWVSEDECRFRPPQTRRGKVCIQRYFEVTCASSLLNAGADNKLLRLSPGSNAVLYMSRIEC